jgi:hypothetical protein
MNSDVTLKLVELQGTLTNAVSILSDLLRTADDEIELDQAILVFTSLSDVAEEIGSHPNSIQKFLARNIISPDAYIVRGRETHPIFLLSKLPSIVEAIRAYKDQLETIN